MVGVFDGSSLGLVGEVSGVLAFGFLLRLRVLDRATGWPSSFCGALSDDDVASVGVVARLPPRPPRRRRRLGRVLVVVSLPVDASAALLTDVFDSLSDGFDVAGPIVGWSDVASLFASSLLLLERLPPRLRFRRRGLLSEDSVAWVVSLAVSISVAVRRLAGCSVLVADSDAIGLVLLSGCRASVSMTVPWVS